MKKIIKKTIALALTVALAFGTNIGVSIKKVEAKESTYPWSVTDKVTTGDYIADYYDGVEAGHVFENLTQERLLDVLSSQGTYYIVFGGPEHETSQKVISLINEQAKKDGISKIYHFDPYVDGYQLDITDEDTTWYGNISTDRNTGNITSSYPISLLWDRIVELLPENDAISDYSSDDTLLFAFSNDGKTKEIVATYSLGEDEDFEESSAGTEIAKVFRGGKSDGNVVKGSVRTNFQFFKRIYNSAATYVETRGGERTADRLNEKTEIFTDADETGFTLKQINFVELIDLLNAEGEHYIFVGASWCHNTQAIIGSVERKAKANGIDTVYVYDTTIGNQLSFDAEDVDKVVGTSSAFNSRNSATAGSSKYNISYLYGELASYFGNFITENNSKQNNSIAYYLNGDVSGILTSSTPWSDGDEAKNAIRLQMPFLLAYNKDQKEPVTKQWLHKNTSAGTEGTYTEYMLELAWVLGTDEAKEDDRARFDGLTNVEFAKEAVQSLSNVLGDKPEETTTNTPQTATEKTTEKTTNAPIQSSNNTSISLGKASIKSAKNSKKKAIVVKIKKLKNAKKYQVQYSNNKKFKKATTKNVEKLTYIIKKLKKGKTYYVRVRGVNGSVKGKWSGVKKVKIKK